MFQIDNIECSCSNDGTKFALIIGGTLSNKKHGVFVIANENDENTFKLILASFDDENDSDDESDSDDKSDNDDDENNNADKNDDENTTEQNVVTTANETKGKIQIDNIQLLFSYRVMYRRKWFFEKIFQELLWCCFVQQIVATIDDDSCGARRVSHFVVECVTQQYNCDECVADWHGRARVL